MRKSKMKGAMNPGNPAKGEAIIGTVSLKHIYEIAKIKHSEERLQAVGLEELARCVVASAKSMGVKVVP